MLDHKQKASQLEVKEELHWLYKAVDLQIACKVRDEIWKPVKIKSQK